MSFLTRIKNNQITDSTILANTKIVAGSIVGSLFNANLTMTSDVTITGNLTVQGTSTYLTIASTNTYVNDPLIVMNNAFAGTNTYDIGLLFNRGSDTNQAFIWDESEDEFRLIATSETGTTYGNVSAVSFANLRLGNLQVQGSINLSTLGTSGNITAWNADLSGDLAVNGGDITSNVATFNLLNSGVTTLSIGGAATTLTLGATSGTASLRNANIWMPNATSVDGAQSTVNFFVQNATTVNAFTFASTLSLGGTGTTTLNAATLVGSQSTQNVYNTVATTVNAFGEATTLNFGANTGTLTISNPTVVGTETTQNLYNTTATTLNFAGAATSVVAGATSGTFNIRNANLYLPNATTIYGGQTSINAFPITSSLTLGATSGTTNIRNNLDVDLTLNARDINNTVIGNVTAASGRFSAIYDTSSTDTAVPFVSAGGLVYDATFNFNYSEKHLTVNNLKIDGSNNKISTTNTNANLVLSPNGTGTVDVDTSRIVNVVDPVELQDAVTLNYLQQQLSTAVTNLVSDDTDITLTDDGVSAGVITANVDATSVLTASNTALSLYNNTVSVTTTGGGNVSVAAPLYVGGYNVTLAAGGVVRVLDTTNSANVTSGALVVTGGAGVGGNLTAANLTSTGYLSVTNDVGAVNLTLSGDAAVNGGDLTTTASTFNLIDANATTVNFAGAATALDIGATSGTLTINNPTVVGSQTTQNLFNTTATTLNIGGAATTVNLGAASGTTTVNNNLTATGNLNVDATTQSTNTTSGALIVDGGVGVAKNLNVGGDVLITGNLQVDGVVTTLNTATLDVEDLNITVAKGAGSASAANGAGLTVDGANATFTYADSDDSWNVNKLFKGTSASFSANLAVTGDSTLTGDLAVNGGDLTTTQTTFNLLNATATTLNVGGAATSLTLGATTGTVNLRNANVYLPNATTVYAGQSTLDLANVNVTTLSLGGAATSILIGATTGNTEVRNNLNVAGTLAAGQANFVAINNTPIGNATPNTGAFTTLTTTSTANVGALTAASINGTVIGNVAPAAATFTTLTTQGTTSLSLTSATAINNTPIGNATPSTGAFTTVTASGVVQVTDSTSANAVGTGAFRVTGGASVGGNLYVGGNINIVGSSYVLTGNAGVFYGDANGFGALYAGVTGYTPLPSTVFQTSADINNYAQNNFQNVNTGAKATTDWVATAGDGSDYDHYIDMGITTSNWDGSQDNSLTNALGANDGYLYIQGNITTGAGGNLVVGASTPGTKKVSVIVGGNTASNITAVFGNPNTTSSSKTTGALTVTGGVGVSGAVYADLANVTTTLYVGGDTTLASDLAVHGGDLTTNQTTFNLFNATATTLNVGGAATALTLGATSGTASIRNANISLPNATTIYMGQSNITVGNTVVNNVDMFRSATFIKIGKLQDGQTIFGHDVTTVGNLSVASNVASTSTSTGAVTITGQGGLGVGGNVHIADTLEVENIAFVSNLRVVAAVDSVNTSTGAVIVGNGVAIGGNLNVGEGAQFNLDQSLHPFRVYGKFANTLIYADSVKDVVVIGGSKPSGTSGTTLEVNGTGAMIIPTGSSSARPGSSGNVDVDGMIRLNSTTNVFEYYINGSWQTSQGSFTVITSDSFSGNGVANTFVLSSTATTNATLVMVNGIVQIPGTSYSISGNVLTFTEAPETGDVIDARQLTTTTTVAELGFNFQNFKANVSHSYITAGTVAADERLLIDTDGLVTVTGDMEIYGNLTVKGNTNGQINIGDANTDNVAINADVNSNIVPNADDTYNLGSTSQRWKNVFAANIVHDQTAVNISSNATPVVIDAFSSSAYSTAKYVVQVKNSTSIESAELLLVHDTANAYITTYAVLASGNTLGTFSANIVSGNVQLYYTSTTAVNSNVKVQTTYIV